MSDRSRSEAAPPEATLILGGLVAELGEQPKLGPSLAP